MDLSWDTIASDVSKVVEALAPVVEVAAPEVSTGISLGVKIIQGVIAAEPVAVALYKQIMDGTQPTATQLADYASQYEEAYQQLNDDINEKLASLPLE